METLKELRIDAIIVDISYRMTGIVREMETLINNVKAGNIRPHKSIKDFKEYSKRFSILNKRYINIRKSNTLYDSVAENYEGIFCDLFKRYCTSVEFFS